MAHPTEDDLGARAASALGRLLLRRTRAHLYDDLVHSADLGVDATTYPVLSGVDRLGPMSAADLAPEIALDRSVASRHASRLVAAGLLRRAADPDDGRATLLHVTPKGRRAVSAMRRRLASNLEEALSTWPPKEAATFVAGLERFVDQIGGA
jgi:DNA-binding MarR family transcriptional regulator